MRDSKRLFLAIDLPAELKNQLQEFKGRWYDFPCRWVKNNILHVTFAFLGDVKEEYVEELREGLAGVFDKADPLPLRVSKITYGPDPRRPRVIWASLEQSQELTQLYEDALNMLQRLPFKVYTAYKPPSHITLCRFNSLHLKRWHGDELPDLSEQINYSFTVSEIALMESKLRRGGPEYFVLHSFMLSNGR